MSSPVLELHVWGPAFGLPSIDPECLATIAYLSAQDLPRSWRPVVSSPSAVPSNALPSLYDPLTGKWHTGLDAIAAFTHASTTPAPSPTEEATTTAWSSYLAYNASPLLALSLYASHTNWTAHTRPAYSKILPFPLAWTEPPRVRDEMLMLAEGLGFEGLDADALEEDSRSAERKQAASLLRIPETLLGRQKTVTGALSPEARALLRLRAEATEVLNALCAIYPRPDDEEEKAIPIPESGPQSVLMCRLYAYLALMYKPNLLRPWLRLLLKTKYTHFCTLVDSFSYPGHWASSLQASVESETGRPHSHPSASGLSLAARFARGALRYAPLGFGEEWFRWISRKRRQGGSAWKISAAEVVAFACAATTGTALVAGAWWFKALMPFGLPVMRFESESARTGLRGLGSAGRMLAGDEDVVIRTSSFGPEGMGSGTEWADFGPSR